MKKLVFFLLSSLIIFAATVYYRLGAYKPVQIETRTYPELHLLYKEHLGAYHKINVVITEVEAWAATHNIPCSRTFGEYLDDPRQVDERRLRSFGGCVLNGPLAETIATPISYKLVPSRQYVVAQFDGAASISPMKVYPKVEAYLSTHQLKMSDSVIEIYSIRGEREMSTEYLFHVTH